MNYAYPAPCTGTAQDLMRVITKSCEDRVNREGLSLPIKTEAQRRYLEPVARAMGIAFSMVMEIIPADWGNALHDSACRSLAGGRSYPFDPESETLRGARAEAERLALQCGRRPALLAAMSHPPVLGDLAHLNFELGRHTSLLLRAVRGESCRPRLVVAVDPFALDSVSIIEEGLYAGYMGSFHIGLDRLAMGRGHAGPALSPQTRWDRMPLRLLRTISGGGEVGLVLSGGVPETGFVLYGIREWVRRAALSSPLRSTPEAVRRAVRSDASYSRFESVRPDILATPLSAWRLLEVWLMSVASGFVPDQSLEAAAGEVLSCLAVPEAERRRLMNELRREMKHETPVRRRLFRLIAARAARARPVILLPVVHSIAPLGIKALAAWSIVWMGAGRVLVNRVGDPRGAAEMTTDELAERFTEENFV
ncbi:MAG: hypothetical protein AAB036_06180 [Elusimicrobiota bacterium]